MIQPYYDHEGIAIYHGDCREILPSIGPVSATVTDPPYGETSLEWDSIVPYWMQYVNGNQLWCCTSMRMLLKCASEFTQAGWNYGQEIVWEKHNGSGFQADRFKRVHEFVTHWYRGHWADITKNVPTTDDAVKRTVRRKTRPTHMGDIDASPYVSTDGGPRLMRSVLQIRSCHGSAIHRTQKPVALLTPAICYSTNPGDTVLDPFCGSGSTLVASKLEGRNAIGIDIDEQCCEMAAKRLEQGVLFQ